MNFVRRETFLFQFLFAVFIVEIQNIWSMHSIAYHTQPIFVSFVLDYNSYFSICWK